MTIGTVWLLFAIGIDPSHAPTIERANSVEYRSERACLAANIGTSPVGTFGVLDNRVFVCRRVNREKLP